MSKKPPAAAWSHPLADLVAKAIDPVLVRQGFGESQIVLFWEDIVGERLATMSQPLELKWPPRGQAPRQHTPATLVVRVESGFALEFQHLSSVVIERVNSYFGYACVDRIALRQGPVTRGAVRPKPSRAPSAAAVQAAAAVVQDVAEVPLRDALARLGAHVIEHSIEHSLDRKDAS